MAGEDACLDGGEEPSGGLAASKWVFPGLGLPFLPGCDDGLSAVVGEAYGAARHVFEVLRTRLSAVEEGEGEAVGEDGAEFIHQVECEGRLTGAQAVEEADVRVEADLFGRSMDESAEEVVREGEQGVDGVRGRAAVAVGAARRAGR